jgi:hypothetical protein
MLTLLACNNTPDEPRLTIVVNPGSFKEITRAAVSEKAVNWWEGNLSDDRACTESFAATELVRFLPSGAHIEATDILLQAPSSLPTDGDVIILGSRKSNPLVKNYPLSGGLTLETDESFRITVTQENDRTVTVIEGGDRVGTLYGVYAYLEELGIRFYGLGETGMSFPAEKKSLPVSLNRVDAPSFRTRGFHAWEDRGNDDFFLWMARNRLNFWTAAEKERHLCKKLGMKLADGGHVIIMNFLNAHHEYPYNHAKFRGDESKPKDPYEIGTEYRGDSDRNGVLSYFEAHPEWFGLKKGKRSDNTHTESGDNYCTSNPDATRELAKNLVQSLIDGRYKYVDLLNSWLMDGVNRWCECEICANIGNPTDRLIRVVHAVLQEIRSARNDGRLRRKVELSSLAYLETIVPPSCPMPQGFDSENFSMTFFPIERCYDHALADRSCTQFNSRLARNYLRWVTGESRHYKGTMFIGEYYNISYLKSMPMLYTRIMAVDIPWYHRTGTRNFHYMHTPTRLWGTWTLNQYLLSRLLWNVATDAHVVVAEYLERFYPSTQDMAKHFYANLELAMAGFKALSLWGWKNNLMNPSKAIIKKGHSEHEIMHTLPNHGADILEMKKYMETARNNLDAALSASRNDGERARLLNDERRFVYGELMVDFHYHLFRTAMFHHAGDVANARRAFEALTQATEQLRSITDLVQVSSSHANADNAFQATQAVDLYEFFNDKYGK